MQQVADRAERRLDGRDGVDHGDLEVVAVVRRLVLRQPQVGGGALLHRLRRRSGGAEAVDRRHDGEREPRPAADLHALSVRRRRHGTALSRRCQSRRPGLNGLIEASRLRDLRRNES